MPHILVTGAAGFIGSHVAESLLQRGDAVVGLDDLNDYYPVRYKRRNLALLQETPHFSFVKGDICDADLVASAFQTMDITHVAHLAARAGVRPSILHPRLYERTNVGGTLNLLEAAVQAKVENFVLASSSSVYGNSRNVPFREDDTATDQPISPYAATKKSAELLSHVYHRLHDLPVNVVRPFTVYGPRGRPDMAPWIFVESAVMGRPIQRFGDGTSARDYTYIDDFVQGFLAALDRPCGFEIFNLGNSAVVPLNEAIRTVAEIHGRPLDVQQMPDQPGDVQLTQADLSKARRLLHYSPQTSFREGMSRFYRWYVEFHGGGSALDDE